MKEKKSFLGGLFGNKNSEKPIVEKSFERTEEKKPETKRTVKKGEGESSTYDFCSNPIPSSSYKPVSTQEQLGADDLYFQKLMQEGLRDIEKVEPSTGAPKTSAMQSEIKREERFRYRPRPIVKKSLIVVLLEESVTLNEYSNFVSKIVDNAIKENFYCVIRYGAFVDAEVKTDNSLIRDKLEVKSDSDNDKVCFYDALKKANDIVGEYLNKIIDEGFNRYQIDSVEIIGIGTCTDNASTITYEVAAELFEEILSKKAKSKYFCVNENFMPNAAMLGFRSIGSLSKEY